MFAKHIANKGLIFNILKDLQLNKKNTNNLV